MIIHWNFDPIAFSVGPITLRWYGLCWAAAFLLGERLVRQRLRALGYADVDTSALTLVTLAGTILGARLVHTLVYEPAYYLAHPLEILAVWEGGLASHGGAIGLVLALEWGRRRYARGLPLLTLTDAVAIPAALGGAFVRLANFLNSEIVGLPTHADWGVVFEQVDMQPRYPVQLFEAIAYLAIAVGLWLYQRRSDPWNKPGRMTGLFFIAVFAARIVLEIWKTPQAAYEAGATVSAGQWLSVPFIALGAWLVWRSARQTAVSNAA